MLSKEHFTGVVCCEDVDGNKIWLESPTGEWIWSIAEFQTWRELIHFVRTNIAPFVKPEYKDIMRVDIPGVREESDGFRSEFMLSVTYSEDHTKVV